MISPFRPATTPMLWHDGKPKKPLPGDAVLNIDETGHEENGQKFWTRCFRVQV